MHNTFPMHVLHALKDLSHVPHNFLLGQIVIITDFLKQLPSSDAYDKEIITKKHSFGDKTEASLSRDKQASRQQIKRKQLRSLENRLPLIIRKIKVFHVLPHFTYGIDRENFLIYQRNFSK